MALSVTKKTKYKDTRNNDFKVLFTESEPPQKYEEHVDGLSYLHVTQKPTDPNIQWVKTVVNVENKDFVCVQFCEFPRMECSNPISIYINFDGSDDQIET